MSKNEKPSHRIAITRQYEAYDPNKGNHTRTHATYVGSAWQRKKGVFSCQVNDSIALTGSFVLFENKDDSPK